MATHREAAQLLRPFDHHENDDSEAAEPESESENHYRPEHNDAVATRARCAPQLCVRRRGVLVERRLVVFVFLVRAAAAHALLELRRGLRLQLRAESREERRNDVDGVPVPVAAATVRADGVHFRQDEREDAGDGVAEDPAYAPAHDPEEARAAERLDERRRDSAAAAEHRWRRRRRR